MTSRKDESVCFVMGRKVTIVSNGHQYIAEPFIVFPTKDEADSAADMVEKVSGERPMIVEASFYRGGSNG